MAMWLHRGTTTGRPAMLAIRPKSQIGRRMPHMLEMLKKC
jgi:hypothetical protein